MRRMPQATSFAKTELTASRPVSRRAFNRSSCYDARRLAVPLLPDRYGHHCHRRLARDLAHCILPRWTVVAGAAVVVLALLHPWIPIVSALAGLAWILLVSVLLAIGATGTRQPDRRSSRSGT